MNEVVPFSSTLMCWYCGTRLAVYASRNVVVLNKEQVEKSITVRCCSVCKKLVDTYPQKFKIGGVIGLVVVVIYVVILLELSSVPAISKIMDIGLLNCIILIVLVILGLVIWIGLTALIGSSLAKSACAKEGMELIQDFAAAP